MSEQPAIISPSMSVAKVSNNGNVQNLSNPGQVAGQGIQVTSSPNLTGSGKAPKADLKTKSAWRIIIKKNSSQSFSNGGRAISPKQALINSRNSHEMNADIGFLIGTPSESRRRLGQESNSTSIDKLYKDKERN